MVIGWRHNMETGAPLVDAQHRALVARVDALLGALADGGERSVVERSMRSLGDYAVRHFSQDEDCALRGQCPALEWNGAARAELIALVAAFRSDYEHNGAAGETVARLEHDLGTWIARYIPGPEAARYPCVTGVTAAR